MPIDFTGPNKWQTVYFNQFVGNPSNRKIKAGLIEPFEIPREHLNYANSQLWIAAH